MSPHLCNAFLLVQNYLRKSFGDSVWACQWLIAAIASFSKSKNSSTTFSKPSFSLYFKNSVSAFLLNLNFFALGNVCTLNSHDLPCKRKLYLLIKSVKLHLITNTIICPHRSMAVSTSLPIPSFAYLPSFIPPQRAVYQRSSA